MGQPAAKQGDQVVAVDTHILIGPAGATLTLPHPFAGLISDGLSQNVLIMGVPAATVGSIAQNIPPHIPTPPGLSFTKPPTNQGTVQTGSASVLINGKGAARAGDPVMTCNDPADLPVGTIVCRSTVLIG